MVVVSLLALALIVHKLILPDLYIAVFLVATLEAVFDSATMGVVPQLVDERELMRASSRLLVAQGSAEQFIGPALGGVAVAAAASLPVLLDAGSFAISAALLMVALQPARRLGLHGAQRPNDGFVLHEPARATDTHSLRSQVREGLVWLLAEPRVRVLCALNAGLAFCQGLGLGVIVVYCTRVLHLHSAGYGLFTAAAASGNMIGAWLAPRVHRFLGETATLIVAGIAGGCALVAVGLTSLVPAAVIALWIEALAVGVGRVTIVGLRQRWTPLDLAGRANAAIRSTVVGSAAIATLVGGALVALIGTHAPFAIGGSLQIIAAVVLGGALIRRLAEHDAVIDLTATVELHEIPEVESV